MNNSLLKARNVVSTPAIERTVIAVLAMVLMLGQFVTPACAGEGDIPITGEPTPGLEAIDEAIVQFMQNNGLPGGALAVAREETINGRTEVRLVLVHGYGFWDKDRSLVTQPNTRFRIASISKPLTATAILKLINQRKLGLHDFVVDVLPEFKDAAEKVDWRIGLITVYDLLTHQGGWDDAKIGFDPMFMAVHNGLVTRPGTDEDITKYMLTRQLDYSPGMEQHYSNFGYAVLGRIIERVSGVTYQTYVRENITGPLEMTGTGLGGTLKGDRLPFEAIYYDYPGAPLIDSVFDQFRLVPWPYGGFYMPAFQASGGWVSTTTDQLRYLVSMTTGDHAIIRLPTLLQPRDDQFVGYDVPPFDKPWLRGRWWSWYKAGDMPGTTAALRIIQSKSDPKHPRTFWYFLSNTRPALPVRQPNWDYFFNDLDAKMTAAIRSVSQEDHWPAGHNLWWFNH